MLRRPPSYPALKTRSPWALPTALQGNRKTSKRCTTDTNKSRWNAPGEAGENAPPPSVVKKTIPLNYGRVYYLVKERKRGRSWIE